MAQLTKPTGTKERKVEQSPALEVVYSGPHPKPELARELAQVLSEDQEMFAVLVAGGASYRQAAVKAGFSEESGGP